MRPANALQSVRRSDSGLGLAASQSPVDSLPQSLDDLLSDERSSRFAEALGRGFALVVVHHQQPAKLRERVWIRSTGNGCVVLQHAVDHAGIEYRHIADRRVPKDRLVD